MTHPENTKTAVALALGHPALAVAIDPADFAPSRPIFDLAARVLDVAEIARARFGMAPNEAIDAMRAGIIAGKLAVIEVHGVTLVTLAVPPGASDADVRAAKTEALAVIRGERSRAAA